MRIGILADIHEDIDNLQQALGLLRREGVHQFVVLGDLFDTGRRIAETADLLAGAGVVGVWGNHDLGLCHEPEPRVLARYPRHVFDYVKTLRDRLTVEGCLFSHGLPHWDATDPTVYYLGGRPESAEGLAGSFAASPCRVTFVGHFHRWLAATPEGVILWDENGTLSLAPDRRYLLVIAAVCDGWCAVYDTVSGQLVAHRLCRSVTLPGAEMAHGSRSVG
jgi:predicted phosphodiesterase